MVKRLINAKRVKDHQINVFYSQEDGGYIANIPDLKYCSAFGKTAAEAPRQVRKAKKLWLETARDVGKRILKGKHASAIDRVASKQC